jgi:FkbM family methyltransferase
LDINEHAVLFARAYEKDENIEAARAWWMRVAEKTPGNSECSKFFNDHPPQPTFAVGMGYDQLVDIKKYFPSFEFQVIFDVGSNVGQSLENYLKLSSGCLVHCFEPSPDSYNQLCQGFDVEPRAILNNLALSNKIGELLFNMSGTSTMNRVGDAVSGNIAVPTLTIDAYCQANKINAIDYLKIDTEGHELNVLSGAKEIIHDVAFVELEASMNPYNRYHTQYKDICDFMFGIDFYLFGLYEQVREWGGGGLPMIRRANPVFFNKKLVGSLPAGLITR